MLNDHTHGLNIYNNTLEVTCMMNTFFLCYCIVLLYYHLIKVWVTVAQWVGQLSMNPRVDGLITGPPFS